MTAALVRVFRDAGEVFAGVPRACAHHLPMRRRPDDPSPFDCGPQGDPAKNAELALSLLVHLVPPGADGRPVARCAYTNVASRTAFELHEDFRREFVDAMHPDGEAMPAGRVRRWVEQRRPGTFRGGVR